MRRYVPFFIVALVVNLFLFLMMHRMISGEKVTQKQADFKGISFIRFKPKAEPPPEKRREAPKLPVLREPPPPKPPPKITKKPNPKLKKMQQVRPTIKAIKPLLDLSRKPYLGDFVAELLPPPPVIAVPVQKVQLEEVVEPIPEPVQEVEVVEAEPPPPEPEKVVASPVEAPIEAPAENAAAGAIEVDVAPLFRIPPIYPRRAIRAKIGGVVTIQFVITVDGSVENPVVIKSSPSDVFDRAALRAIRKWKFRPKRTSGKAVVRHAIQNIRFNIIRRD